MTTIDIQTEFPGVKDKYVILTGGSSGIGLAAAELLTSQGAHVLIADPNPLPPNSTLPSSQTHYHQTDVTSWPSLLSLFTRARTLFPRIDAVIANAGIGELEDILATPTDPTTGELAEPSYKVLDVNLKGVMNTARLAVHHFLTATSSNPNAVKGRIILTASTAGYLPEKNITVYCAAKHGVVGYMRALSASIAKHGIEVNCVAPWFTESGLIPPEFKTLLEGNGIGVQKAGSVARGMAFLVAGGELQASHEPKASNGQGEPSASQKESESKASNGQGEPSASHKPQPTPPTLYTSKTIYIANNTFSEIEGPIRALRPQWLGEGNADRFEKAQWGVELFS